MFPEGQRIEMSNETDVLTEHCSDPLMSFLWGFLGLLVSSLKTDFCFSRSFQAGYHV
jgi:hypothetical protein